MNGDTPASLTTPPVLSTTASSISPVGSYPIVPSGATSTNYAITFNDGPLTIAQASSLTTMVTPGATSALGQTVSFTVLVSPAPTFPTGIVNFYVDGTMTGAALIDPSTGLATWATWALGVGSHTITAAYSGNANFLSSQAGSIPQAVTRANTQSLLIGKAVRNRRGRIVTVKLDAHVQSVSPGSGLPTGPVTFFVGRRRLGSTRLIDGTAVLAVRSGLVLNKGVTVRYAGEASFLSSLSPKVVITRKSMTAAARPFAAFFTRSHGPAARPMSRHASHGHGIG